MARRTVGEAVSVRGTQKAIRVQWDADWEEYRVGTGPATYHTGSYRDAIGTAFAMALHYGPERVLWVGRPHRPAPGHE